jgi:hypothetical protein
MKIEPPENGGMVCFGCTVEWEPGAEWVRDCFSKTMQFANNSFVDRWGFGLGKVKTDERMISN